MTSDAAVRGVLSTNIGYAVLTFTLGILVGHRWLKFLQRRQFGKQLNPSEPSEHAHKAGTPTMGGVVFLAPTMLVVGGAVVVGAQPPTLLIPLALGVVLATLGWVDDMRTLVRSGSGVAGVVPATKWVVEVVSGLVIAGVLDATGYGTFHVPFWGLATVPSFVYIPFAAFVIVATTSSVAITDGLDSLAATTGGFAFLTFWIVSGLQGNNETSLLSGAVVGGLLAYLWFNAYPAQMWMGDVGSLPLGGMLAIVALMSREPFLLIPAGVVFIANALADIAQVLSMKLRGRRVLLYAPLHHHFERLGWKETWVVQRFWIAGAVGALVAVWGAQW